MSIQLASNKLKDAILSEVVVNVMERSVYNSPFASIEELTPIIEEVKANGLGEERIILAFTKAMTSLCNASTNTDLTKKRCKHIANMLSAYLGIYWD